MHSLQAVDYGTLVERNEKTLIFNTSRKSGVNVINLQYHDFGWLFGIPIGKSGMLFRSAWNWEDTDQESRARKVGMYEEMKINWRHFEIFFRTTGLFSTNLLSWGRLNYVQMKSETLSKGRYLPKKIDNILNLLLKNHWANFNSNFKLNTNHCWMKGI